MSPDNTPLDEHPFFHLFAEMLPTGLAILDHNAQAVFVNKHFYQLTTHPAADKSFKAWLECIHPDDSGRVLNAHQDAFRAQVQLRIEFRTIEAELPWRLLHLAPLADENLRHVSLPNYGGFICSVVDITCAKREEESQRQAAAEAEGRKQQQERFIDMISHEIRNPLSAVLHCVEDIEDILRQSDCSASEVDKSHIFDAVETINLCISQQKSIVDDVLTYSKLDSSMLSLAPTPSQPEPRLRRSLKIFQPELRKWSIYFEYFVDTGYMELEVDWAMADLARINQVITNLISNAIKFTSRKDGEKKITCKLTASAEWPSSYPPDIVFFNPEQHVHRLDATEQPEWGDGESIYIMLAICDNGIGINDEDQKKLFERFKQATPRTQEVYGGSGLGLNISRKLVHLHGGEIGVASKEGNGATFGFFFRVKRTNRPEDAGSGEGSTGAENRLRYHIRTLGLETTDESDLKEAEELPKRRPTEDREREVTPGELRKHSVKLWREQEEEAKGIPGCGGKDKEQYGRNKDSEEGRAPALKETENAYQSLQSDNSSIPSANTDTEHDISESEATRNSKASQLTHESLSPPSAERGVKMLLEHEPIHVLLVEDNIVNQRIVQRKLIAKGFRVSTASNGREAVDLYTKSYGPAEFEMSPGGEKLRAIDVILMDQEMPVMDGNAATREIRSLERKRQEERNDKGRVPILGVSANVREEQLEGMTRSGMDNHMTKPYKIDDMIFRIHELLNK